SCQPTARNPKHRSLPLASTTVALWHYAGDAWNLKGSRPALSCTNWLPTWRIGRHNWLLVGTACCQQAAYGWDRLPPVGFGVLLMAHQTKRISEPLIRVSAECIVKRTATSLRPSCIRGR